MEGWSCSGGKRAVYAQLDAEIVRFFVDFDENDEAQQLILDVLKQELDVIRNKHQETKRKLK